MNGKNFEINLMELLQLTMTAQSAIKDAGIPMTEYRNCIVQIPPQVAPTEHVFFDIKIPRHLMI